MTRPAWSLDVDEYVHLGKDERASVDRWLAAHDLLDKRAFYVEVNEDLVIRARCWVRDKNGHVYRAASGEIAQERREVPLRSTPPAGTP